MPFTNGRVNPVSSKRSNEGNTAGLATEAFDFHLVAPGAKMSLQARAGNSTFGHSRDGTNTRGV